MPPNTLDAIGLEDLTRWIRSAPPVNCEKGMLRLARAANEAARGQSSRGSLERRRKQRTLVPKTLQVTSLQQRDDGFNHEGELIPIVMRYVSEGGIDFYSADPLPHRHVYLRLPTDDPQTDLVLVTELRWCRFSKEGIYVNGGVFCDERFCPRD